MVVFVVVGCGLGNAVTAGEDPAKTAAELPAPTLITVAAVGDVMAHMPPRYTELGIRSGRCMILALLSGKLPLT